MTLNSDQGQVVFHSKLRNMLWPIKQSELRKFLPMIGMMFSVLFNQNVLRIIKDSLIISEISPEAISFTKVYCVTPVAALFVVIYAKMVNVLSFDKIYYYLISFFMGFFIIFAFVIYPRIHSFHADARLLTDLVLHYPYLKWYIIIAGNWSYVLFYTLAELWPNIFYVLLFWQCANEVTTTQEAKRFYTFFALFGNSALICVGLLMKHLSSKDSIASIILPQVESKIAFIQISTILLIFFALLSCLFIKFIYGNIFSDPALYGKAKNPRSIKTKLGMVESFKYILHSRYLWLMLVCSASFGLSMNLVEAVWKAKISQLHQGLNAYAEFSSSYILWTGVVIMIMTLVGNNLIRKYSWFVAAIITPITIAFTGSVFFALVVFDNISRFVFESWNTFFSFISHENCRMNSILAFAVTMGAIQNILAKGAKYSVWDSSREMLYIPLDEELKTKGKASVDLISSKIGKSTSGLLQSIVFTVLPNATLDSISGFLLSIFLVVCITWISSVRQIYLEYQKIV
ncbi:NTP/NDP exchange transporter Tlc5 [Rickettsiales endosymbiont of Paramecium tredecaurelia]|uniref:Npt1/Npt2 family nucleotide transporter n=1 Tax=Candidatus Sarmatiella mevalonica TaxID=2770581 RepID=UPI001920B944|nr:Npt1/Npt2 family nucleotide transporter [Candidatus Sarmatiella mevalonica]MBL3285163.1 NTP/NDP exchange transporter Tlc5 [Candidatus Sarmatiella mevalonica]